jgi:hypothetical protein
MKDNDSVLKHIHRFRTLLEQLSVIRSLVVDDEAIPFIDEKHANRI